MSYRKRKFEEMAEPKRGIDYAKGIPEPDRLLHGDFVADCPYMDIPGELIYWHDTVITWPWGGRKVERVMIVPAWVAFARRKGAKPDWLTQELIRKTHRFVETLHRRGVDLREYGWPWNWPKEALHENRTL